MIVGKSIIKRTVVRLAATRFAREALAQKADLRAMRAKPSPRLWTGLGLMGFSYIIGWPRPVSPARPSLKRRISGR